VSLAEFISEHVSSLPPERQKESLDFVMFLEQRHEATVAGAGGDAEAQRRRVATALDALRGSGVFADIANPVAWQRDIRKDRPLPAREKPG